MASSTPPAAAVAAAGCEERTAYEERWATGRSARDVQLSAEHERDSSTSRAVLDVIAVVHAEAVESRRKRAVRHGRVFDEFHLPSSLPGARCSGHRAVRLFFYYVESLLSYKATHILARLAFCALLAGVLESAAFTPGQQLQWLLPMLLPACLLAWQLFFSCLLSFVARFQPRRSSRLRWGHLSALVATQPRCSAAGMLLLLLGLVLSACTAQLLVAHRDVRITDASSAGIMATAGRSVLLRVDDARATLAEDMVGESVTASSAHGSRTFTCVAPLLRTGAQPRLWLACSSTEQCSSPSSDWSRCVAQWRAARNSSAPFFGINAAHVAANSSLFGLSALAMLLPTPPVPTALQEAVDKAMQSTDELPLFGEEEEAPIVAMLPVDADGYAALLSLRLWQLRTAAQAVMALAIVGMVALSASVIVRCVRRRPFPNETQAVDRRLCAIHDLPPLDGIALVASAAV